MIGTLALRVRDHDSRTAVRRALEEYDDQRQLDGVNASRLLRSGSDCMMVEPETFNSSGPDLPTPGEPPPIKPKPTPRDPPVPKPAPSPVPGGPVT